MNDPQDREHNEAHENYYDERIVVFHGPILCDTFAILVAEIVNSSAHTQRTASVR